MKKVVFVLFVLLIAAGCNNGPELTTQNVSDQTSELVDEIPEVLEDSAGGFQKVGLAPSPSIRAMLYKGRVELSGTYRVWYPETLGGGMVFFNVDTDDEAKLPRDGDYFNSVFGFKNQDEAKTMLKINTDLFADKTICEFSGKATIVVEGYELLMADVDGSSMSTLKQVVSAENPVATKCTGDNIRERQENT